MQKPWLTPEFYATVLGNIIGLVVLLGGLTSVQGAEWIKALTAIAGGILAILTSLGYINAQAQKKVAIIAQLGAIAAVKPEVAVARQQSFTKLIKELGV